jgi:hypothetical protein
MRAVMRNINDIVMLATDGVVSKSKLPVECPPIKTLGKWENAIHSNGGIFAQSGFYLFRRQNQIARHSRFVLSMRRET